MKGGIDACEELNCQGSLDVNVDATAAIMHVPMTFLRAVFEGSVCGSWTAFVAFSLGEWLAIGSSHCCAQDFEVDTNADIVHLHPRLKSKMVLVDRA